MTLGALRGVWPSMVARRVWMSLSFSTALFSLPALAQEYLIKMDPQVDVATFRAQVEAKGTYKVVDVHEAAGLVLVRTKSNESQIKTQEAITEAAGSFEYMVPNFKLHAFVTPNDPKFAEQWSLQKVRASEAWDRQRGNQKIVVAVIDTGIDWKHEDLKDRIWGNSKEIAGNGIDDDKNGYVDDVRGWDFHGNDADPNDETGTQNPGHGTHCAGIVAASADNSKGVAGMAPNVSLMPIRFLGADGSGDLMNGIKAIDYAIAQGAQVISASWGAAVPRAQAQPLIEAIQRTEAKGVVFVAAAANDGKSNDTRDVFPANAGTSNIISVAASGPSDAKPTWSNYGRRTVDLASPGEGILSTVPNNNYSKLSGTSMATPLVSGLVALMLSEHAFMSGSQLKPTEAKALLQASSRKVEIETACFCRVDAADAITFVQEHRLTVVPNAKSMNLQETAQFDGFGGQGPYTFSSSDPLIANMDAQGKLTGIKEGKIKVTVTDAAGHTSQSHDIFVGGTPTQPPANQCPVANPQVCEFLCMINPTFPWCK